MMLFVIYSCVMWWKRELFQFTGQWLENCSHVWHDLLTILGLCIVTIAWGGVFYFVVAVHFMNITSIRYG